MDAPQKDRILIIGDSLSAGYGIDPNKGWAALLQKRLSSENFPYQVINASISGDTTLNGLNRLKPALDANKPRIVLIELGANDGLRGLPLGLMEENLAHMIEICQSRQAKVLLVGMYIPPNYGKKYSDAFHSIYYSLSSKYSLAVVPFLLEGVGTNADLMQNDGLHPTAHAQPILLNNVWDYLKPLL